MTRPIIECCSTHCERRQECASPNDCVGQPRAACIIPNCQKGAPAAEPFCVAHRGRS